MASAPVATIAICTANRARRLAETIEAVLALASRGPAHELLVVDNGSTDETPELLSRFASWPALRPGDGVPVRSVRETEIGLSAARNRAVREARGEWIVFLDDDALPEPGWLDAYAEAFSNSGVAAAGGPVEPIWSAPFPDWFEPRFAPYVSAWDRGPVAHPLAYNEYPRGANIAFRRALFDAVGDFSTQLGRRGKSLRSCEEIELCLRLERSGRVVLYAPAARVRHHVDVGRLTEEWMLTRFAAQGFSEAILEWRHGGGAALRAGGARARRSRLAAAAGGGASALFARCLERSERAYRRGAIYAVFLVPRYAAPDGASLAPFHPLA